MPAYNHASYVRTAVESVLGQTYGNLELIVIDDASSDATWEVLQSFEDERVRLYRHDTNQGAHATLNEALKLAKGEFIAIINSDDVYHPERLARLVAEAGQFNGKDSLIFTDVSFVDAQGAAADGHPRALGYKVLSERCATLPANIRLLAGNLAISTSNFFFSRSLAEIAGAFAPLRYTHDWDWALRASVHGAPTWVREPLLSYRVHAANTLSEDDSWRHIHENSYVQAKALLALGQGMAKHGEAVAETRFACLALLENESFHPLALSLYLIRFLGGVDDHVMLALSCTRDGNWMLKELADAASCPDALFGSIGHLAERDTCIAAQTALIEEKDQGITAQALLIDEKDQGITAQALLIDERDRYINELLSEITDRSNRIARLEEELADLYGSRVVKTAMAIRRWLD